ncbi:nitrogen fixation protein NifX [Neorhizobium galegae]|uniref:nitrogen fixation protein NifX n=1 Tax=Neorhizobium galegae TaxID=399 RepID=UPI002103617F|nr:nitrogen fixation protein NifX [Neorhizobium galegae]MCQ1775143.1 nitrogen fixation protein NifX [Neorhizobium galegae]
MSSIRRLSLVDKRLREIGAERPAGTLRLAIATQDMKRLNGHFGSAERFAIYDVTPDSLSFIGAVVFENLSDELAVQRTPHHERLAAKIAVLASCQLFFCIDIGGPSAARVISANIHPIKLPRPEGIGALLARVQSRLKAGPPPWLRRAIAQTGARGEKARLDEKG